MSNIIDLSKLPAPQVLEDVDFENLLAARKEKFIALWDAEEQDKWRTRLQYESEPVVKLLQENCFLELLLRNRINAAAKAVMLAYATGNDLDQLGALFGVSRLIVRAADPKAQPPITEEKESDSRFRERIQKSLEGISTAGSRASYEYHALTASAEVKGVTIDSPTAGNVRVTILSSNGQGTADGQLIATVTAALNAETVRPLTDTVQVQSAQIVPYQIAAVLTLYPSVLESMVLANVNAKVNEYAAKQHALGLDITLSGIYAALHQEGVQNVTLTAPSEKIVITPQQAAYCTAINLTIGGRDE